MSKAYCDQSWMLTLDNRQETKVACYLWNPERRLFLFITIFQSRSALNIEPTYRVANCFQWAKKLFWVIVRNTSGIAVYSPCYHYLPALYKQCTLFISMAHIGTDNPANHINPSNIISSCHNACDTWQTCNMRPQFSHLRAHTYIDILE